jgi:signal transduction histidine kinase/CheY-like chemotaxis protein
MSPDGAIVQIQALLLRATGRGASRTARPVGRHLAAFAVALAVPILIFAGTVLWQFAARERARLEEGALDAARAAAVAIDRELAGLSSALEVLVLSTALRTGDLPRFHGQAVEVRRRLGLTASLRDANGQQLLNARMPWGADLPRGNLVPPPAAAAEARPVVSDGFVGALAAQLQFAVQIPVPGAEGPPIHLALSMPIERIRRILDEQGLPPDWTAAVVDSSGTILARSHRHDEFAGQRATADLLSATAGQEGTWNGTTIDGHAVLGAYARTSLAGWRVAVGVPQTALSAPLRQSLRMFAALGAALALLSLVLAGLYARRIAGALRQLETAAAALGRGEHVAPPDSPIREAEAVGRALAGAAQSLRHREAELRLLNADLEDRVRARTAELQQANAALLAAAEERERTEGQLRHAQKMEAVGRLTGGVAHDFNNLLTVVLGNLALARRRIGQADERALRALDHADEGARRAAELTQRLLAFSRQQPLAPQPVDANRLVTGMSDLLGRSLGEDIQVETVLAAGLWRAHADPSQLESTLLNLAVNARDAMPRGGKLTIETANCHLDEAYAATRDDVRAGQYVMVSVSDTGTGMSAEVAARAFEPFFTTKPAGKGTGLGLSHVYGFAKQSGGHAAIYSEPGQGTTIRVYLPRQAEPAADPRPAIPGRTEPDPADPAPGGGETILVAEDDPLVRDFAVAALEEAGWRVLAAEDGPATLALLEAEPAVALLFTDVVLVGPMNGRELADAALALRPGLPVLFTTGYTRNAIIHHGRLDEGVNFLGKPYAAQTLVQRVGALLAAR